MTTTENGLTIVRHETDRMTSVYRGRTYLGSALPINRADGAWTVAGPLKDRVDTGTEHAAIDYLAA